MATKKIPGIICPVYGVYEGCEGEVLQPLLSRLQQDETPQEDELFTRGYLCEDGRLDMCKQSLGVSGTRAVLQAVEKASYVTDILLGTNYFGDEGAKDIAAMLAQRDMDTVYLGCNFIGAEGAQAIANAITEKNGVRALWLKRNPVSSGSIPALTKMLESADKLEVLDLVNTMVTTDDFARIADSIITGGTLKHLHIGGNGMGADSGAVAATLITGSQLETLYFECNALGDEGVAPIIASLAKPTALKALSLGSNNLSDTVLADLMKAVATSTIERFDLMDNRATKVLQQTLNNPDIAFNRGKEQLLRAVLEGTGNVIDLKLPAAVMQIEDYAKSLEPCLESPILQRMLVGSARIGQANDKGQRLALLPDYMKPIQSHYR